MCWASAGAGPSRTKRWIIRRNSGTLFGVVAYAPLLPGVSPFHGEPTEGNEPVLVDNWVEEKEGALAAVGAGAHAGMGGNPLPG